MQWNDEIVSIEELDERELIDIEVSGDHLFYANGILTKNSIGTPMIADFIAAMIRSEELDEVNEIFIKVLKNRYSPFVNRKFILGTNLVLQKFFDIDQDPSSDLSEEAIKKFKNNIKEKVSKKKFEIEKPGR